MGHVFVGAILCDRPGFRAGTRARPYANRSDSRLAARQMGSAILPEENTMSQVEKPIRII